MGGNSIIFLLLFPLFYPIVWDMNYLLIGILFGLFNGGSFILYNIAVSKEEISIVGPLNSTVPLFVVLFAVIFLNEMINSLQILGVFAIVFASIIITYSSKTKFKISKGISYILLYIITTAALCVFLKYFVTNFDSSSFFFYSQIGFLLLAFPLLCISSVRKYFFKYDIKQPVYAISLAFLGSGILWFSSMLLYYYVLSKVDVSLVNPVLNAFIPLSVLFLSFVATKLNPKLLKERFDKKTLSFKIMGVILLSVGIYLLMA